MKVEIISRRLGKKSFPTYALFKMMLLGLAICACSSLLQGQERGKQIQLQRLSEPPKIDGRLDDNCWKGVEPVSGFFQYDPVNGAEASEETSVWMGYDQHYIYFAFMMKDSQPGKIWAELTPRNEYELNDSITVILDTYNDRRTSIQFTVNPRGVQKNSVETIWKSEAMMQPDGWSAEIAIPFKSLRFSSTAEQVWGINFERYIHRLNEQDYWTNVSRDKPLLLQMGEARGLTGIRPGYNLEFFPYAGYRTSHWAGEKDNKFAAGIDVKYGVLPNLILDLTASPDFSEVESDPFIYQLSPYENYFHENRPFFTEGSQYFQTAIGDEEWNGPSYQLFYSRRVDNPKIATKLTGKAGGYSFGILQAVDKNEDAPNTLFSVVRVQKDIFSNSQVGFYFTGMSQSGDYNRNIALDYNFNFRGIYRIKGLSAFSFDRSRPDRENGTHIFEFERDPDAGWWTEFTFKRIEKNVRVRTGFVSQTDLQNLDGMAGYAWRHNQGPLKRLSMGLDGGFNQDSHGNTTGRSVGYYGHASFRSQFDVEAHLHAGKSRYQIWTENDELVWTNDFINTRSADVGVSWDRGGLLKEFRFDVGWEKKGIYNDRFTTVAPGTETRLEAELTLRPRSNLECSFGTEWIRQVLAESEAEAFNGATYSLGLHYQMTRNLFLTTRLLGETREDQYNFDVLLGYYFGAGNIIQLVYKKSSRAEDFHREGGYSIAFKVSYLLRI